MDVYERSDPDVIALPASATMQIQSIGRANRLIHRHENIDARLERSAGSDVVEQLGAGEDTARGVEVSTELSNGTVLGDLTLVVLISATTLCHHPEENLLDLTGTRKLERGDVAGEGGELTVDLIDVDHWFEGVGTDCGHSGFAWSHWFICL